MQTEAGRLAQAYESFLHELRLTRLVYGEHSLETQNLLLFLSELCTAMGLDGESKQYLRELRQIQQAE
jgi:hypothetical protein